MMGSPASSCSPGLVAGIEGDRVTHREHHQLLAAADSDAGRPLLRERHGAGADPRPSARRARLGARYGALIRPPTTASRSVSNGPSCTSRICGSGCVPASWASSPKSRCWRSGSSPACAGAGQDTGRRQLAGGRGGRRAGGDGSERERWDLPHNPRLDRAAGRRARPGGCDAARPRPRVSDGAMRLDVVVVSYRSAPLIGRTIAVARGLAGPDAGLIVVDNSPGDGAAAAVRAAAPEATIIANSAQPRLRRGREPGGRTSHGPSVVLLLNPDVGAHHRERRRRGGGVRRPARRGGRAAARRRRRGAAAELHPRAAAFRHDRPRTSRWPSASRAGGGRAATACSIGTSATRARVDAATGACLFLRRTALADVGPFDERFFVYYEETDWLIRARRRGWRTVFLPAVEAMHASAGSSPGARARPSLLLLESQHRYARKHFGRGAAGLLRAALLGIDAARLARMRRRGRASAAPRRASASASTSRPRAPHPRRWRSPTHARSTASTPPSGGGSPSAPGTSSPRASGC